MEEQGLGFGAEVEEEVDGTEVGEETETGVEDLGIGRELKIENFFGTLFGLGIGHVFEWVFCARFL